MSAREEFIDHTMLSGAVCFYRESDHSYWSEIKPKAKTKPEGEWTGVMASRLTGISTVVKPFDFEPEGLLRWAAKTNGVGIARLIRRSLDECQSVTTVAQVEQALEWTRDEWSIWRALEEEGLTYADLRDERAEEGTNVHKYALEALAQGHALPNYEELTETERGFADGVSGFWIEHMPGTIASELVVMHRKLRVAGRLDLRATLGVHCGRPVCPCKQISVGDEFLADAKTSGYIPNKHHVQLSGYEVASVESGWDETAAQWILQVAESGDWKLVQVRTGAEDFVAAVDMYRRADRLGKVAAKDRKAQEAVTV